MNLKIDTLLLSGIVSIALVFAGCASGQTDETTAPDETAETTTEESTDRSMEGESGEMAGESAETETADNTAGTMDTTETTGTSTDNSSSSTTTTVDNSSTDGYTGIRTEGASYSDGSRRFATSGTKFILVGRDDISQLDYLEYRIGDGPYKRYLESEPITLNQEGSQRILYRGVDKVGNVEPENQYAVIIDNSAPDVNHTINGPTYDREGSRYASTTATVQLEASDRHSGVKSIEYNMNDQGFTTYAEPVALTEAGTTTIKYRATDNLGNVSETKSLTLIVDNTSPDVEITSARELVDIDGKLYTRSDNSFGLRATDDSSGLARLEYRVNGEGEFQPYSTRLQFDNEGNYKIEAKAVDYVGNESEVKSVQFTIDNTPPKSNLKKVDEDGTTTDVESETSDPNM